MHTSSLSILTPLHANTGIGHCPVELGAPPTPPAPPAQLVLFYQCVRGI